MSPPPGNPTELWKLYPLHPKLAAAKVTVTPTPTFAPIPTPTPTPTVTPAPSTSLMTVGVQLTIPAAATFVGLVVVLAFLAAVFANRSPWPAAIAAALEVLGVLVIAAAITAALAAQGWL